MSDLCKPDLLEAWIDETASAEEAQEMERHVVECRTCSNEATWQRRERKLFAERARALVKADHAALWAKLAPQLEGGNVTPIRSRSATLFGGLVAAAAALLCMVKLGESFMNHKPAGATASLSNSGAQLPEAKQAKQAEPTDHRWSFNVGTHPRVLIDNPDGDITVVASTNGEVTLRATTEEALERGWHVDTKEDKGVVMTRVWCEGRCGDAPDVSVMAQVPEDSELIVHAVSADLKIDHVHGRIAANTVDGDVELNSVGEVQAKTVNGEIALLGGASVATKLESVSGDLTWKGKCSTGCALALTTVSGDVELGHTDDSGFHLKFQTVSGEAPTLVSANDDHPGRRHVMTVNDGKGSIAVKTVSGEASYTSDHTKVKIDEDHKSRDLMDPFGP